MFRSERLFCALCPGFNTCLICMQLCDQWERSKYGAAQCKWLGGCQGAAFNTNWATHCYPNIIWSGTPSGSEYWSPHLNSGTFHMTGACTTGHCPVSLAFTVRCVLDLRL